MSKSLKEMINLFDKNNKHKKEIRSIEKILEKEPILKKPNTTKADNCIIYNTPREKNSTYYSFTFILTKQNTLLILPNIIRNYDKNPKTKKYLLGSFIHGNDPRYTKYIGTDFEQQKSKFSKEEYDAKYPNSKYFSNIIHDFISEYNKVLLNLDMTVTKLDWVSIFKFDKYIQSLDNVYQLYTKLYNYLSKANTNNINIIKNNTIDLIKLFKKEIFDKNNINDQGLFNILNKDLIYGIHIIPETKVQQYDIIFSITLLLKYPINTNLIYSNPVFYTNKDGINSPRIKLKNDKIYLKPIIIPNDRINPDNFIVFFDELWFFSINDPIFLDDESYENYKIYTIKDKSKIKKIYFDSEYGPFLIRERLIPKNGEVNKVDLANPSKVTPFFILKSDIKENLIEITEFN